MYLHDLQGRTNLVGHCASCLFVVTFLLPASVALAEKDVPVESANVAAVSGISSYVLWTDNVANSSDSLATPLACTNCGSGYPYCQCRNDRWVDLWDGRMEIGLNGSEGNSRNVNLVLGFDAKREVGLDTLTLEVDYLFSRDETETTKNRLYSLTRWVHDIPNSYWGTFADGWFEYDEFESYKSRLGLHAGGIVTLFERDDCVFKGLIGLGTSREMSGPDAGWTPEGFIGSVWEKTLTSRQDFYVKSIIYPNIADGGEYRFRVRAGWEYALNEEKNLKLSLSAYDRYDSSVATGDRKNNVDYWASLIWAF